MSAATVVVHGFTRFPNTSPLSLERPFCIAYSMLAQARKHDLTARCGALAESSEGYVCVHSVRVYAVCCRNTALYCRMPMVVSPFAVSRGLAGTHTVFACCSIRASPMTDCRNLYWKYCEIDFIAPMECGIFLGLFCLLAECLICSCLSVDHSGQACNPVEEVCVW